VWDEEVLPSGEADVSGSEFLGNVGDDVGSFTGHAADGDDDAEVVVSIGLFVGSDVAVFDFGARFFAEVCGDEAEGEGEFLLNFVEEFGGAPVVDEVFETSFFTVGAVAIFDEDAKHGGGEGGGFAGGDEEAAVGGELLVSGDAAELDAEVDSGVEVFGLFFEGDGVEGDVIAACRRGRGC